MFQSSDKKRNVMGGYLLQLLQLHNLLHLPLYLFARCGQFRREPPILLLQIITVKLWNDLAAMILSPGR